jgi:hypothetical protein
MDIATRELGLKEIRAPEGIGRKSNMFLPENCNDSPSEMGSLSP